MSLIVTPEIKALAAAGGLTPDVFYQCIKKSLPFAVDTIHRLAHDADRSDSDMAEFAPRTLSESERGELLRAAASTSIRRALEVRFREHQSRAPGILIGFKNCHNVAVFLDTPKGKAAFLHWTSAEEQVLAQSPELVDC